MVGGHRELQVYKRAFGLAMQVFEASRAFPREETYSLVDQMRRSSRSVAANISEAWRKRRYKAAFIAKLSDAETEAAETQCWIEFAVKCKYLPEDVGRSLYRDYDRLLATIVGMIVHADKWILPPLK